MITDFISQKNLHGRDIGEIPACAQKTKNPENKEEDFLEYMDDDIFCEIMKRINKKELTEDDFFYIEKERKIREEVERFERG